MRYVMKCLTCGRRSFVDEFDDSKIRCVGCEAEEGSCICDEIFVTEFKPGVVYVYCDWDEDGPGVKPMRGFMSEEDLAEFVESFPNAIYFEIPEPEVEIWVYHDNFGCKPVHVNGVPATDEDICQRFLEQFPNAIYFVREVW